MPSESSAAAAARRRDKPRVHPIFKVEEEGQSPEFELAFDVAVMAPLYGDRRDPERLEKRDFVQINSRNFDETMAKMKPRLDLEIEIGGKRQRISIQFESMKDFEPGTLAAKLADQIPELQRLLKVRQELLAIKNEGGINPELRRVLEDALGDGKSLDKLLAERNRGNG